MQRGGREQVDCEGSCKTDTWRDPCTAVQLGHISHTSDRTTSSKWVPPLLRQLLADLLHNVHIVMRSVDCSCTMSSLRKFTFAISSPDEFLVLLNQYIHVQLYAAYASIETDVI